MPTSELSFFDQAIKRASDLHSLLSREGCEIIVDGPRLHVASPEGRRATVFEAGEHSKQQIQMLERICTAAQHSTALKIGRAEAANP